VRLRQICLNLLGNAVKFTDRGWVALRVMLAPGEVPSSTVRLRFEVADTGIGIEPDKQQLIFESFRQADGSVTRRFGGTGLGLSISSRLVTMMGGTLSVQSAPGRGSTFTFDLPVAIAAVQQVEKRTPDPCLAALPPDLRVLVAEDNPINQKVVLMLLERLGVHADLVGDGQQAVERTARDHYDVVLMDVQMPVLDGLAATRAIRDRERATGADRLPIIALTARAMAEDSTQCTEAGMDGFVTKPIDRSLLVREITGLVPESAVLA
jgi:CheY-like chemotaxis protein